jgi:hypothetical protein
LALAISFALWYSSSGTVIWVLIMMAICHMVFIGQD